MAFSILLKRPNTIIPKLLRNPKSHLSQCRSMGGGPRTFPGGLNKWQWKRMHEKKARDKERRLLEQEKQVYHARIRSQIRSNLAGESDPFHGHGQGPMSPRQHIKALADRFVKEGAEDLWNSRDGPIRSVVSADSDSPPVTEKRNEPLDLRNWALKRGSGENLSSNSGIRARNYSTFSTVSNGCLGGFGENCGNVSAFSSFLGGSSEVRTRTYSAFSTVFNRGLSVLRENCGKIRTNYLFFSRNYSSFSTILDRGLGEFGENCGNVRSYSSSSRLLRNSFVKNGSESSKLGKNKGCDSGKNRKGLSGKKKWFASNESSDDDSDEDDEEEPGLGGYDVRRMGSSASLGKWDMKVTRTRLSVKEYKGDISDQIEVIRHEISQKKLLEEEEENEVVEDSFISQKRFDELEDVSPLTIKALSLAGYVKMTGVQEAALSVALEGKDILVKAKTGTGKTAAFLIPAIETVLKAMSSKSVHQVPPVFVLIICPTRELASQIAAEANVLLRYHDGIGVQTLVGGTRVKDDRKRLESSPSQIIVATPGRLLDHIENKGGLCARLTNLHMLILDEASQLLHLGFSADIEKIADCMPRRKQTLLFSAQVPIEVRRISRLLLKREHRYINSIGMGNIETVSQVKQSYLIAPHEFHFKIVHHLLKDHISRYPDYKVIVFCPTAMLTSLMYRLLHEMKMNVREMHTKKPQPYRGRVTGEFKESKGLILVTSDVSAWGMNYPDVTLVVQVGIPISRDQYIHRLGRTAREGKEGEGILLLAPWEGYFLQDLRDLPVKKLRPQPMDPDEILKMEGCMAKVDGSIKEGAYLSWLGYYNSIKEIGRNKTALVASANKFCETIGLERPPGLNRKTAVKMGLKGIRGIEIKRGSQNCNSGNKVSCQDKLKQVSKK